MEHYYTIRTEKHTIVESLPPRARFPPVAKLQFSELLCELLLPLTDDHIRSCQNPTDEVSIPLFFQDFQQRQPPSEPAEEF